MRDIIKKRSRWIKPVLHFLYLLIISEYLYPHRMESRIKSLKIGDVATTTITAPFSFVVKKSKKEIERERRLAMAQVYPYFSYQPEIMDSLVSLLETLNIDSVIKRAAIKFIKNYYRLPAKIIASKRRIITDSIVMIYKGQADTIPVNKVKDLQELKEALETKAFYYFPTQEEKRRQFIEFVKTYLIPNMVYMKDFTEKKRKEAASQVSETREIIEKGEIIVRKGDTITPARYDRIQAMYQAQEFKFNGMLWKRSSIRIILFAVLILNLLFTLYVFNPQLLTKAKYFVPIHFTYTVVIFTAYFVIKNNIDPFFTLIPFMGLILSMVIGRRFSTFVLFLTAVVIAIYSGTRFDIFLYNMLIGFIATLSARTIKTRFAIYYALLILFVSELLLYILMQYSFSPSPHIVLNSMVFQNFSSSFFSILLFIGLLPIYERTFKVATDFWLMELSNLNHAILKQLAEKAPGTFTHSVSVGNLASVAAEMIGANALLARVASYYHDIGKMKHPAFFIENQLGENPHDLLSPEMSAKIIISHVDDGVEIAQKYRLPEEIIRVIKTHHGRSLLVPFYVKAKEMGKEVKEEDFRYKGPLPVSKEESIVMLADSVEAAVRSLKTRDKDKIRAKIKEIIEYKIEQEELKDSQLTLSDIAKIEEAFYKMALSIIHTRGEYPDVNNKKNEDTMGL